MASELELAQQRLGMRGAGHRAQIDVAQKRQARGGKPLTRLRQAIDPHTLSCAHRCSLFTCQDVVAQSELDLVEMLDLDLPQVRLLVELASKQVLPTAPLPASSLIRAEDDDNSRTHQRRRWFTRLGLAEVDQLLGGGLLSSSIFELVGPAGVGKTQFCHQIALETGFRTKPTSSVSPPQDDPLPGVLYLDTEGTFSAKRLQQMAKSRQLSEELTSVILSRVHAIPISSSTELRSCLDQLEGVAVRISARVLILDSIASLLHTDDEHVLARQELITEFASFLKELADRLELCVVVTNQVTPVYEEDSDGTGYSTARAAFGPLWAHCVNTRMVLQLLGSERSLTIAKCPICPVSTFLYQIQESGVCVVPHPASGPVPSNYLDLASLGTIVAVRSVDTR